MSLHETVNNIGIDVQQDAAVQHYGNSLIICLGPRKTKKKPLSG
jgi:hypothetical protein